VSVSSRHFQRFRAGTPCRSLIMSKRKAPEPVGSKAAGKRRADAPSVEDDATDDLVNSLLEGDDVGDDIGIDQLLDSEADGDDVGGDDVPLSDFDCPPEDLLGLQQQDSSFTPAPDDDEVGELPDDLAETQLVEPEQVDLSKHTLTLPQARCVARLLAQNGSLAEIRFEDHSLPVGDMKDSEELEWDSEEYTDIDAIIIAELLKNNTSVERLDLARCRIADAGAVALAQALAENTRLEYLNLESNTFGEKGGSAFCDALGKNESVQYLNLMYNSVPVAVQDRIRGAWKHGVGLHL